MSNAELVKKARAAANMGREYAENCSGANPPDSIPWENADLIDKMADALEAAALTSAEDLLYVKRMEAERDEAIAYVRLAKAEALEESAKAIGWTLDAHWEEYADTDAPDYVTISTIQNSILAHAAAYRAKAAK